jgi:hypothetical protein
MAKDRSAHEAARGAKMVAISDLSKQRPTGTQLTAYPSLLLAETDRGAALMAGALVENTLELAIRAMIVNPGDLTGKSWFEGPNAPFSSFSAKITLGRAIGIYGASMGARLGIIKDIRNAFAHSSIPLDFAHPTIHRLVLKLVPSPERVADRPAKLAFGAACLALSRVLANFAGQHGGKEITVHFP